MQIATVVPAPHAGLVSGDPYRMALAHLIHEPGYVEAMGRASIGDPDHLILDNGAVETGRALVDRALLSAADALRASELVVPGRDRRLPRDHPPGEGLHGRPPVLEGGGAPLPGSDGRASWEGSG